MSRMRIEHWKMWLLAVVFGSLAIISAAHAAPQGGQVVGGSGSINQSNLTTNIQQNTQKLAIDWQSYNLNSNEKVNYLQPNSSSIALNRVLGGSASQIFGQINANGQVVLVNPNGIFFSQGASINVGGLIASGLDISSADFMNGNYLFNEIEGTDGLVINSGLINASLGGNVGLIGKQVENKGVISAQLGSVVMAVGKEAVLTFDNNGLIGVQVTQEVLQDDIGVDPAVLNNGDIEANGGRVLLTASVSKNVFSSAVNEFRGPNSGGHNT
jgi:filamentous hemagglutinin family protein